MHTTLDIDGTETTSGGFAPVDIVLNGGQRLCQLDLQYSELAALPEPNDRAVDFLLIAAAVYSIDKLSPRSVADDSWTRELGVTVPVSDAAPWRTVQSQLASCLSYLTGDDWQIDFVQRSSDPTRPRPRRQRLFRPRTRADAVSLFSGGLDSLVGVIDWLETHPEQHLVLVGHHDGQMPGPYADQRAILTPLRKAYPGRITSILARVGHSNENTTTEITLRARSLVFIALGIFAASALGQNVPLFIPENGTIALNVPLTPSRRGSCSTRTAHPHYLASLGDILPRVGLATPFSNPLEGKTKGEAVEQCANQPLLSSIARLSVSCAKRGHRVHWTRRTAKSCGRCMPCIYRRAAMHVVGWDDEVYGDDICTGEVDLADDGEKSNDLRACFSFLKRNPSSRDIATMLIASGSLEPAQLDSYSAMVRRTMDEIRQLLRDKATSAIKRSAGV